jgi:hypothetical protein
LSVLSVAAAAALVLATAIIVLPRFTTTFDGFRGSAASEVGRNQENWAFSPVVAITTSTAVNPTARTVGSLVFLSIVCAPVLIGRLLAQRAELTEPSGPGRAAHARQA